MSELALLDAGQLKEQQRLEAVSNVKIGNADIQERFDRITRIAKIMFAVSVADFSLIKQRDQQIVSASGLISTTIARDISFESLTTIDRSTKMAMNQGFYALAEQSLKVCERNKIQLTSE